MINKKYEADEVNNKNKKTLHRCQYIQIIPNCCYSCVHSSKGYEGEIECLLLDNSYSFCVDNFGLCNRFERNKKIATIYPLEK